MPRRRSMSITAESPLEISSGEHVTVVVIAHPLPPGMHELEAKTEILALGELVARWRDQLV